VQRRIKTALFPVLHFKTKEQKILIRELRNDTLSHIQENGMFMTENNWSDNVHNLEHDILKKDPRNFLNWNVVKYTMFHTGKEEELKYLKKLPNWNTWRESMRESPAGNPPPYPQFPESSGNTIHHAYSLAQMLEIFDIRLKDVNSIFEFGGGYGGMARLAFHSGFAGSYTIFDLPQFTALQKYFLKSAHIDRDIVTHPVPYSSQKIILLSDLKDVKKQFPETKVDITIATWSLSESPVELRLKIFDMVRNTTYFLIAYQNTFGDTDNVKFFTNMIHTHPEYEWKTWQIPHLPGNYYLFGKRK
jgi:hypothetical protein